ncbi:MAG TPA: potassium channel family protein [Nitrosopumilaceae archaeon]|nr:potassium channel family protein [Nitrosopumilaceae archaeon]
MKIIYFLLIISATVVLTSGVAIYFIESPHEDAQITNIIDAFWWAAATVTTVGYGDVVSVTDIGRIMGIGLMFVGISIIGVFISAFGAILIGSRLKKHDNVSHDVKRLIIKKIADIEKLEKQELDILLDMVKDLHSELRTNSTAK